MNEVSKLIDRTITDVAFDSEITSIGAGAFFNCTSLQSVTIPSTVTSIGDNAFYNTKDDYSNLCVIEFESSTPPTFGNLGNFFSTISGVRTFFVVIPVGSTSNYSASSAFSTLFSTNRIAEKGVAVWDTVSIACEYESGVKTGYLVTTEIDRNPTSSTYNQTRTTRVQDTTVCAVGEAEKWVKLDESNYTTYFNNGKFVMYTTQGTRSYIFNGSDGTTSMSRTGLSGYLNATYAVDIDFFNCNVTNVNGDYIGYTDATGITVSSTPLHLYTYGNGDGNGNFYASMVAQGEYYLYAGNPFSFGTSGIENITLYKLV